MVEAIRQGDIPGVQLRCRQELPAPSATVWRWLTEPELLARWVGQAQFVGGPAGTLELATRFGDERLRERAESLETATGRCWVLAFKRLDDGWETATRLTFELEDHGASCELSVLQQGFEHLPLSRCLTIWELYRRRWRAALTTLAEAVGSSTRKAT